MFNCYARRSDGYELGTGCQHLHRQVAGRGRFQIALPKGPRAQPGDAEVVAKLKAMGCHRVSWAVMGHFA